MFLIYRRVLYLVNLELEKLRQQNLYYSTCAQSLQTFLPGYNSRFWRLTQFWKRLVSRNVSICKLFLKECKKLFSEVCNALNETLK